MTADTKMEGVEVTDPRTEKERQLEAQLKHLKMLHIKARPPVIFPSV